MKQIILPFKRVLVLLLLIGLLSPISFLLSPTKVSAQTATSAEKTPTEIAKKINLCDSATREVKDFFVDEPATTILAKKSRKLAREAEMYRDGIVRDYKDLQADIKEAEQTDIYGTTVITNAIDDDIEDDPQNATGDTGSIISGIFSDSGFEGMISSFFSSTITNLLGSVLGDTSGIVSEGSSEKKDEVKGITKASQRAEEKARKVTRAYLSIKTIQAKNVALGSGDTVATDKINEAEDVAWAGWKNATFAYTILKGVDKLFTKTITDNAKDTKSGSSSGNVPTDSENLAFVIQDVKDTLVKEATKIQDGVSLSDVTTQKTSAEAEKLQKKETCLDAVAKKLNEQTAETISKETIDWVNKGLGGKGFFPDSKALSTDLKKAETEAYVSDLKYLDESGGSPYAKGVVESMPTQESFANKAQYTLGKYTPSGDGRDFESSFLSGGWDAWEASLEPQNNPIGFSMLAANEYAERTKGLEEADNKTIYETMQKENDASGGFYSEKVCVSPSFLDGKDVTDPQTAQLCQRWENKTPASIVAGKTQQAVNTPLTQAEIGDEVGETVSGIFKNVAKQMTSGKGIRDVSFTATPQR